MELKELLALFRRQIWLLFAGLLVGLLGGYFSSYYMKPVYEASSKLMISRDVQEINSGFIGLNSQQLAQTYIQILKAKPLMDTASERVGTEINPEQVLVQQILDTQIIEIKVEDFEPDRASLIANTMAMVLIEQNGEMQTDQYVAMESLLVKQGEQVKAQADAFQAEYDQLYELDYQNQLNEADKQIININAELSSLQMEIEALNPDYSRADKILAAKKQARVEQLQSMFVIYEQLRANLLILGRPLPYGTREVSSHMQQLQSSAELYQNLYLTHMEDIEKMRLAHLQQKPNVVQIEGAIAPKKPVRPIPLLYTLLSGISGLMLAVVLVFSIEALGDNQEKEE